jgi:leader peptidase (prepilin peptidase)/N-methyltransferase
MILLIAFVGLLCGVLVNYLSDVLPVNRRIPKPICVACFETQPFLNYLIWPRRCQECWSRRPLRVWLVEITYIGISLWLWNSPPDSLGYILGLILFLYFGVVVVIDLEHRLILHPVSWAGAVLCLAVGWYLHGLISTLIGGAVGYLLMLGLHYFGDIFARWLSRRRGEILTEEALGFGDVNLSGVLGLLLGWPGILAGLFLAVMLGGIVSILYIIILVILRRYKTFTAIPYGPFLVASAVILIFLTDTLRALLS